MMIRQPNEQANAKKSLLLETSQIKFNEIE